jgi:hypothetical protein
MSLFSRTPEPPENQTGQTPPAPTDNAARQQKLEDDRAVLATAEQLAADGDLGGAQFWRRLLGD